MRPTSRKARKPCQKQQGQKTDNARSKASEYRDVGLREADHFVRLVHHLLANEQRKTEHSQRPNAVGTEKRTSRAGYDRTTRQAHASSSLLQTKLMSTPPTYLADDERQATTIARLGSCHCCWAKFSKADFSIGAAFDSAAPGPAPAPAPAPGPVPAAEPAADDFVCENVIQKA